MSLPTRSRLADRQEPSLATIGHNRPPVPHPVLPRAMDLDEHAQVASAVEEATAEAVAEKNGTDPAPSPLDITHDRAERVMQDVTDHSLLHMTMMRDEVDEMMRDIRTGHDAIVAAMREHARIAVKAVELKEIATTYMASLREQIAIARETVAKVAKP